MHSLYLIYVNFEIFAMLKTVEFPSLDLNGYAALYDILIPKDNIDFSFIRDEVKNKYSDLLEELPLIRYFSSSSCS